MTKRLGCCKLNLMKTSLFMTCVLCSFTSGCSLITVPVKTAGSIVTTTVSTTGKVVAAPFNAIGRSKDSKEEKKEEKKAAEEEQAAKAAPVDQ